MSFSSLSVILLHNLLRERGKISSLVHLLPEVRLGKHRQCVPCNFSANAGPCTSDEVGNSLELAFGDDLECFSSLEAETVPWYTDLDRCTGS